MYLPTIQAVYDKDLPTIKGLLNSDYKFQTNEVSVAFKVSCEIGFMDALFLLEKELPNKVLIDSDCLDWCLYGNQATSFEYLYEKYDFDILPLDIYMNAVEIDADEIIKYCLPEMDEKTIDTLLEEADICGSERCQSVLTAKKRQFKLEKI
jgi:hypothetical protein